MRTPSTRRPTLADVAERAGLSPAAVSLILNNRPGSRLSADAIQRAQTAAAELGYSPNPAAQSLRFGKTRTIGFASDQVTLTRYASGMIRGVLDAARSHGHTVLMAETGSSTSLTDVVHELADRRVDGLLIGLMAAREIDLPQPPHGIPFVIVNGTSGQHPATILPDERRAGRAIARYLTDRGHHHIALLGGLPEVTSDPRRSVTISARFAGITEALRSARATLEIVEVPSWSPEAGYTYGRDLLTTRTNITAVIAGNDNVAFGIYQAAAELRIPIPAQLSIISFDDEELAGYQRPGLTSARLPYETMAHYGVQMLLGERPSEKLLIPMPIIERSSVQVHAERH